MIFYPHQKHLKLLPLPKGPCLTNGHFAIPEETAQEKLLLTKLQTLIGPELFKEIKMIRLRCYDGHCYNISIECNKPEGDSEASAVAIQKQLSEAMPKDASTINKLRASQVSNYVDLMISAPHIGGEFHGKGITLARVQADHPDTPKENFIVIGDSAHHGGNDTPMMTDAEHTTCYHLGDKPKGLDHIQTTFDGKKLTKGHGTTLILRDLLKRVEENKQQHEGAPQTTPLQSYVLILDVDGTLTINDGTEEGSKITPENQAVLQELLKYPNVFTTFCTARGADVLDQQADFFKAPETTLALDVSHLNGTHIIDKKTLKMATDSRDFQPLVKRYQTIEIKSEELLQAQVDCHQHRHE